MIARGDLVLDETKHTCTWKGKQVQLTVTEFLLVKALAARPGMVKNRDQLIDAAYGENIYVDDRTIDSHVKRVRKKFRVVDDELRADRDALRHRLPLQGSLSGAAGHATGTEPSPRMACRGGAPTPVPAEPRDRRRPPPAAPGGRRVSPLLRRILLRQHAAALPAGGVAALPRPVPERPAGGRGGRGCAPRPGSTPTAWPRPAVRIRGRPRDAGARGRPPPAAPPDRAVARTPRPSCSTTPACWSPTAACARAGRRHRHRAPAAARAVPAPSPG